MSAGEAARQPNGRQQSVIAIPALSGWSGTTLLVLPPFKGEKDETESRLRAQSGLNEFPGPS